MYKPTKNRVFVEFQSTTNDVKVLPSGHKLYMPTAQGRIELFATVVGKVHSCGGKLGLTKGEEVACAYQIISNYELRNDGVTVYRNYYRLPDDSRVWKAEADQIMAVKRNGEWVGLGDWMLMEELTEKPKIPIFGVPSTTEFKYGSKEEEVAVAALLPTRVLPGVGRTQNGNLAYFDEGHRSMYEIEGKKCIILPKRLIVAYSS